MKCCVRLTIPLILLLLSGCATQPRWARYEMAFGLTTDSGRTRITDEEWQTFREEHIVTQFPDGFTVVSVNGYWRDETQTYAEPSMFLMLVAPDTHETRKKVASIAQAYKQRFRQQAVLQIKSRVNVDFTE